MASNNRDVKMTLSVETLGASEIKTLQDSVSQLARQGGDAAPQFEKLADEIGRLGQQADALRMFQEMATATQQLEDKQQQATATAEQLRARLAEAAQATQTAAQAQRAAADAYSRSGRELTEVQGAIRQLNVETDAAGKKTTEYRTKLTGLIEAETQLKVARQGQKKALSDGNAALSDAEKAQQKLTSQYAGAEKSLASATARLREQRDVLEAQRASTEQLGLNTVDLAQAQAQLVSSLNASGAAARDAKAAADALAASEAELTEQAARARQALADRIAFTQKMYADDVAVQQRAIEVANERAEAERRASEEAIAAKKREQAESDRLYALQEQGMRQMRGRAAVELEGLSQEWREHGQTVQRIEREKAEAVTRSSREASQAIASAFDTVGARSATELRGEIDRVRAAMAQLRGQAGITGGELQSAMTAGKNQIKELERELRAATNQLTLADRAAGLFANSMGQIAAGNLIADGIASIIEQVKGMGREFLAANLEMERLTRTMTVVTGSAEGAAAKIQFLRDTANSAGVSMGAITDSFIRFQASASASGMAAEEVDGIFKAVTVSGSRMGMTSDRVALALDALGQIASKNTVSMEELRQQLGDSLPGAFAITAKGLDVTTEKLVKMVENGELLAGEFFPAFRRGLEETFGDADQQVEGLFQAFQRLRNAFRELYQEASDSSAFTALAQAFDFLAKNLSTAADMAYGLGKAFLALKILDMIRDMRIFGQTSKAVAAEIGVQTLAVESHTAKTKLDTVAVNENTVAKQRNASVIGGLANGLGALGGAMDAVQKRGGVLQTALDGIAGAARGVLSIVGGLPGLFVAVALNAESLGKWLGESAAKMMGYGKVMEEAEAKLKALDEAEKARIETQKRLAEESVKAIRNQGAALTELRVQSEADVKVAEKQTETAKEQAALSERIARLYGDEAVALDAATTAAQTNLVALENESAAKNQLVLALQDELTKKTELINASTNVSEKMREELTDLQNLLAKKREESAQAAVGVQNARLEAAERQLAAQAYRDNAAGVEDYRLAIEAAKTTVTELQAMQVEGLNVDQAMVAAQIELARVTGLYNDSVKDKIELMKSESSIKQSDYSISVEKLKLTIQELKASAELAKAKGNEREASDLLKQAKEKEIELDRLSARAKYDEAEASVAVARFALEEARASGQVGEAKLREMEATLRSAEAQKIAAQSAISAAEAKKVLAKATEESESASVSFVGQMEEEALVLGKVAAAARDAAAEKARANSMLNDDDRVWAPQNIKDVRTVSGGTMYENYAQMKGRGAKMLSSSEISQFNSEAGAAMQYLLKTTEIKALDAQGYNRAYEALMMQAFDVAISRIDGAKPPAQNFGANSSTDVTLPTTTQTSQGVKRGDGNYTVNVNLNGRTTGINTATRADADALAGVFKQLESSASRY